MVPVERSQCGSTRRSPGYRQGVDAPRKSGTATGETAFTYSEVGATQGEFPTGYHHLRMTRHLGTAPGRFEQAAELLLTWQMHRGAGLAVRTSSERIQPGTRAVLGIGVGPARIQAPVEVVYVIDEPDRQGFAYGTLPGHPECGEERFVIVRSGLAVRAEISAFSRPAVWFMRAAGPAGRLAQRAVAGRYLRALG